MKYSNRQKNSLRLTGHSCLLSVAAAANVFGQLRNYYLIITVLILTFAGNAAAQSTSGSMSVPPLKESIPTPPVKTSTSSPCVNYKTPNAQSVDLVWANTQHPPCKVAIYWLKEASFTVLGRILKTDNGDEYILMISLLDIGSKPAWKAKFDAGLKQSEAIAYIKETASANEYRFRRIFPEIYGREINKTEDFFYKKAIEAKEQWYLKIYQNEFEKLSNNPQEKEAVVGRVFMKAMGRDAYLAEVKNWKIKLNTFDQLIEEIRNYLYSPAGKEDLKAVVKSKLFSLNKKEATPEEIEAAIGKYKAGRKIFSEM